MTSNSRYSMLDSMDIRCARCGYENDPKFRFCGMCGAALRPRDPEQRKEEALAEGDLIAKRLSENRPEPVEPMPVEPLIAELTAAQKAQAQPSARSYSRESREESYPQEAFHGQRTPVPVSGMSFLGLSDSGEDRRVEYLLEDEPSPGRARKVFGVLLLLAIIAGGGYYWRKAGYPWPLRQAAQSSGASSPASPERENSSATASEVSPPMATQRVPEKPKTGVGDRPLANDTSAAAPASPAPQALNPEKKAAGDETAGTNATAEAGPSKTTSAPAAEESKPGAEGESAKTESSPAAKPEELRGAASKEKPSKPSAVVASAPNPAQDSLYIEGQKYLYGTGGVPANCARAQQYLTTAANNNNPKAQSTLGTMYATGHCASRNLPLAYRWFARALHGDPSNTRLEQDVEIMWNQMSPQEKQLALKNQ
ncbi:MAG: zinc-ribbon domain-containing protein [Terriglobales bacterium]